VRGVELRQFAYFATIVREGSFSRAARTLHVGQPALSKQIRSLESEIGVQLLVRVHEGVRPTDAGRRLHEMCDALLSLVDQVKPAVRAAANELSGTVTVGVSPSLVPALAEHLRLFFASHHPGVRLQLVEALPMFSTEWVDSGRLDAGIFRRPPSLGEAPRLDLVEIGTDEVVLVGTPAALADHGAGTVAVEDLRSLPVALTPGFRELVWAGLDPTDSPLADAADTDSIHMVKALALRGDSCSVMPWNFVQDEVRAGLLASRPFDPPVRSTIVCATRAGLRSPSEAVSAVVETSRRRLLDFAGGDRAAG
jgi:LysR family nitrogen assimilation transcriptional regulator